MIAIATKHPLEGNEVSILDRCLRVVGRRFTEPGTSPWWRNCWDLCSRPADSDPDYTLNCGEPDNFRGVHRQRCLDGLRGDGFQPYPRGGVIASTAHARARTATIRAQLIQVTARIANHARTWWLHLPRRGPGKRRGRASSSRPTTASPPPPEDQDP